jgi:hypothetical protein
MLDACVVHAEAELITRDIDVLMSTLVPDPVYTIHGTGAGVVTIAGQEAVRAFYLGNFASLAGFDTNQEGLEIERFVVDDDMVAIYGTSAMTLARARALFPDLDLEATRPCVLQKSVAVFCPFIGEKMTGEIMFWDGPFAASDAVYLDEPASPRPAEVGATG